MAYEDNLTSRRKKVAASGESIAALYLQSRGYCILERNWRSGRFGELDIIARDADGLLIFVEVKTRAKRLAASGFDNNGFEAVDWRKQRKILICANSYLARARIAEPACRFDIVVVEYNKATDLAPEGNFERRLLTHVTDAFGH